MGVIPGAKVVGTDWTTGILQAKCEETIDKTGHKATIYYRDVKALWKARLPDFLASLDLDEELVFVTATARQIEFGKLCEVQVQMATNTPATGTAVPETEIGENGGTIKASITKHPKFADGTNDWRRWWNPATKAFDPQYTAIPFAPATMPDYLIGVTDYELGSMSVAVTDYFADEPDSVEPLLGKYAAPPKSGPESATKYLILSGGKNKRGQWWTRTLIYQFGSLGVDTHIYEAG